MSKIESVFESVRSGTLDLESFEMWVINGNDDTYQDGYENGHIDGYDVGFQDGYDEGRDAEDA